MVTGVVAAAAAVLVVGLAKGHASKGMHAATWRLHPCRPRLCQVRGCRVGSFACSGSLGASGTSSASAGRRAVSGAGVHDPRVSSWPSELHLEMIFVGMAGGPWGRLPTGIEPCKGWGCSVVGRCNRCVRGCQHGYLRVIGELAFLANGEGQGHEQTLGRVERGSDGEVSGA